MLAFTNARTHTCIQLGPVRIDHNDTNTHLASRAARFASARDFAVIFGRISIFVSLATEKGLCDANSVFIGVINRRILMGEAMGNARAVS